MDDRYGTDVLAAGWRERARRVVPRVEAERDLVVEVADDGWCGAVVGVSGGNVELEDRHGRRRLFPLGAGFLIDGEDVVLVRPEAKAPTAPSRTASGSFAVEAERARVARASRILVEGRHDAELVEHVWGDDLAEAGIAVQLLEGVDNLEDILEVFGPNDEARAGVLVDHLVSGSKESRIAAAVEKRWGSAVLVLGHPFVDVWQAVKPARLGLRAWPEIPRGTDIKHGTLEALGWPHADQADIAMGWKRILATVRDYRDLEPALLGRVEALIDFVTEPGAR